MGGSHSREDMEIWVSDEEFEEEGQESSGEEEEEETFEDSWDEMPDKSSSGDRFRPVTKSPSSLDEVEAKLKAMKLKYPSNQKPCTQNAVRLFLYINGNTPKAKWVICEKLTAYSFLKTSKIGGEEDDDEEDEDEDEDEEKGKESWWVLKVGTKIREKVSEEMQLKAYKDQRRVDLLAKAVWALKLFSDDDYKVFVTKYNDCLFENNHGVELNDANKAKIYGKDFMGWADPEAADDSMWEDADDILLKSPESATPLRETQDLTEAYEEAASGGVQSLALGALDNSFLVGDSGIQVFKNLRHGIQGKGVCINFDSGNRRSARSHAYSTPKKALLMRAETNMLLMSPM